MRKAVRSIGQCAIRIDAAADQCVQTLVDLLTLGVNHIVQETLVVMKDIFRKYASKYEGILINV